MLPKHHYEKHVLQKDWRQLLPTATEILADQGERKLKLKEQYYEKKLLLEQKKIIILEKICTNIELAIKQSKKE